MTKRLQPVQEEILRVLRLRQTSYANPLNSVEIGGILHISPCYIRRQLSLLVTQNLVEVRRGNGGGYYVNKEIQIMKEAELRVSQNKYLQELRESLAGILVYLPGLIEGWTAIGLTLQTGKGDNVHERLAQALEGVEWSLKLLSAAQSLLNIDYQSYEIEEGINVAAFISGLTQILDSLLTSYQNRDVILTADIIEYELIPQLALLRGLFTKLMGSLDTTYAS